MLKRDEKSFIISDSEEEAESYSKRNNTCLNTRIIKDTDTESENSENAYKSNSTSYNSDIESVNSDEDDVQFMNKSHKVSIIDDSSDSQDDLRNKEKEKKMHKLKRHSIFENSVDSRTGNKSTPLFRRFTKKSRQFNILSSDSDDVSVQYEKESNEKNLKSSLINDNVQIESKNRIGKATNSLLSNKTSLLKYEELNTVFDTVNDDGRQFAQGISTEINDSTDDCSIKETNVSFTKEQKPTDEIIIASSTSTSESEINEDVMTFVKREIGVSNIDPIEAQKKEQLCLQIDFIKEKLYKVCKFAESIDVELLPDKGVKVYDLIRQHQEELLLLKTKLAKLARKSEKFQIQDNEVEQSNIDLKTSFEDANTTKKFNKNRNQNIFNEFDVRKIPSEPKDSFNPSKLSEKAMMKYNKDMSMADQRLQQLHKSLVGRPAEDQKEKDPTGLKISLMPHQQHALAWIKWRETQKPSGGILADDMGLGKTLTMISLILSTSNDDCSSDDESFTDYKDKRYYGGTLVVCPASLIDQWNTEIKNRCKRGLLSTLVFHGNNRNMEDRKLSKYNVVITTYQVLVREASAETSMYQMEWNRVIIDEAHYIRNHKSKACLAVCGLHAKHKWALTGTPIQNKEMDLYAILKFLKCSPFDNLQSWKRWVDNKSEAGKQRLITIMKTLLLRRTKQELQSNGTLQSLPDKNVEIIEIEMDHEEKLVYQKMLLFSQNLFAQFLYQRAEKQQMHDLNDGKVSESSLSSFGSKTQFTKAQQMLLDYHRSTVQAHEILTLLLRLRQLCCHPALIHSLLDKDDAAMNGLDDEEEVNTDLLNRWQNMSINENDNVQQSTFNYKIDKKVATNLLTKKNPVFNNDRRSSKIRAVMKIIKRILRKGDKLIVVSQWTSFLKVVAQNLEDIENAKYAVFTGNVPVKDRQAVIDKINDPCDDVNILLLSLTAGGVGLNIIGANHLLLIDIHWNPQLEAQAQDRIYRFGQNKSVYIYQFICKDTIEERVKRLQDNKLEVANNILTGTRLLSSKLTVEDLKLLFS